MSSAPPLSSQPKALQAMPNVVTSMAAPKKVNPLTPALKSPIESQLAKAIIDAKPGYRRGWLEDALSEESWLIVKAIGEDDRRRKPNIRLRNSLLVYTIINYERKVLDNTDEALIKCEGAESEILRECLYLSDVELDL